MTDLNLSTWIGVFVLGGLGAIARFLIDALVSIQFGRDFPLGTLAINISGAIALGFLDGAALTGNALILAGTATLGAYTTFSTWVLETHRLREDGELTRAFANSAISLTFGIGAVALGHKLGVVL